MPIEHTMRRLREIFSGPPGPPSPSALIRPTAPAPIMVEVPGPDGGAVTVAVELRSNPRARRTTLRFDQATDTFRVTAPPGVGLNAARRFVAEHAGWIAKRFAEAPPRRPFRAGGSVPILGVDHLIVHLTDYGAGRSPGGRRPVERGAVAGSSGGGTAADEPSRPALIVTGDPAHLSRRIEDYMKAEARRTFGPVARDFAAELKRLRPDANAVSRIAVRDARTRWGSCSAKGALAFSWRLMLAPDLVMRYVVAHEVAHLAEMNHSPRFWALVHHLMPDAPLARTWLAQNGAALHRIG
jgi:predicted metal-dependent hydrolase